MPVTLLKKKAPVSSRFYLCLLSLPPLPCVLGARRIYHHRVLFSLGLFNSLPEISFNQMGLCYGAQSLTWSPPPCSVLMAAENLTAPDPRGLAWAPGEEGPFLLTLCRHQSPHFPWCSCLFPSGGRGQLVLDLPSSPARSGKRGISSVS